MKIGPENPTDADAITRVHDVAFGQQGEGRLVCALRESSDFDRRLSLVAQDNEENQESRAIIGHILFTPIKIETETKTHEALALAPVAVIPDRQRQGIGALLIIQGHNACRNLGHAIVVVLGHADYYPRFGFDRASKHGIKPPFEVPDESFMVLSLSRNALQHVSGTVRYPPPFAAV